MSLIEKLPQPLEEALTREGCREAVVAGVATDLSSAGRFGQEWLVLTPERLRVYEFPGNGGGLHARVDLPLAELKSASADGLVGGGALLATLDGRTIEVLRYSNAQQRKFSRVAKYLNDTAAYRKDRERPEEKQEKKEPPTSTLKLTLDGLS